VATDKQILSYNLKTRLLAKKFKGLDLPRDIHIHSSGDYLIAACEDCRLQWYDYDLESTPYKTFKFHNRAIVTVSTSRNYPLMATGSLDRTIHLFHA